MRRHALAIALLIGSLGTIAHAVEITTHRQKVRNLPCGIPVPYENFRATMEGRSALKTIQSEPGRLVLETIDLPPFWVQRGEPLTYFEKVPPSPDLRKYRNQIERVEIQFYYR